MTAPSGFEPDVIAGEINGEQAISSYGRDCSMQTSVNFPNLTAGGAVFMVAKQSATIGATNSDTDGIFVSAGISGNMSIQRNGSANQIKGGINSTVLPAGFFTEDTFMTISLLSDGTNINLYINGLLASTAVSDNPGYIATVMALFKLSIGLLGNKMIAFCIVYDQIKTDLERLQNEAYFQARYGHY